MTIEEISAYLKLPVDSLYKYARHGKIPAFKVGRYWRFDREQIDQWVRNQRKDLYLDMQVLVIDDDVGVRELLSNWLAEAGCIADTVSDGAEGLDFLRIQQYDLILLDLQMPEKNGVETLRSIVEIAPQTDVVIVTAYFESNLMDAALNVANLTVLRKPLDKTNFLEVINRRRAARAKH